MVPIIADDKRLMIAVRLAEVKAIQVALIANEEMLLAECDDPEVRKRLADFLDDDRKNLNIINNTIVQYGVQGTPRESVTDMLKLGQQQMQSGKLSYFDKISAHELLKHQAAMSGILVHKAAQVVGADIDAAIAPLNTVNFENRAHQEQLKGIMEVYSTRELTGKDPDQGLWARVQDSLSALTGIFGSVMSRSSGSEGEMKVTDYVRMDHQKVNTLFGQIQSATDPAKKVEYFNQLYGDLSAHAQAEDNTWYAELKRFDDSIDKAEYAYQDQDELEAMLEDVKRLGINSPEFDSRLTALMEKVVRHVNYEESELFAKLRQHFTDEQLIALGRDFQAYKARVQQQLQQQKTTSTGMGV